MNGELVYRFPKRQQELIHLAKTQIQVQKNTINEIRRSSLEGAHIIAAEIEAQATELQHAVGEIVSSAHMTGLQITEAIERIGDRICADLTEIRWQLIQQQEILNEILQVLRESRINEARQLVNQGVRHYVNDEYSEAEERFLKALCYDTTDYQVLMNLGFIEIHKDNFNTAVVYFKKALKLPEKLDSQSKARTLNALARLHYSKGDYNTALRYAEEAVNVNREPGGIYKVGIYAALSGQTSLALTNIELAVAVDPAYFAIASVDPDLISLKQEILNLLSKLSIEAKNTAYSSLAKVKQSIKEGIDVGYPVIKSLYKQADMRLKEALEILQTPTYTILKKHSNSLWELDNAIQNIKTLKSPWWDTRIEKQQELDDKCERYKNHLSPSHHHIDEGTVSLIMIILLYVITGLKVGNVYSAIFEQNWLISVLLWPLAWVASFLGAIFGSKDYGSVALAGFKGILIGIFACIIIWIISYIANRSFDSVYTKQEKWAISSNSELAELKNVVSSLIAETSNREKEISLMIKQIYFK